MVSMQNAPPPQPLIRVLIVEDEPELMRRFSQAVLNDQSLSLVAAVSTGTAALAVLSTTSPDVILLDLGLPDTVSYTHLTLPTIYSV